MATATDNPLKGFVAVHGHTNWFGGYGDAKNSVQDVIGQAAALGYSGVVFTEHTSNPDKPEFFDAGHPLTHALLRQFELVGDTSTDLELVVSGIEPNLMSNGRTDAPLTVLQSAGFVIASQHGGLGESQEDGSEVANRLVAAIRTPLVHAIGHPTRHQYGYRVRDADGKLTDEWRLVRCDWSGVYAEASLRGCAIEINLNQLRDFWKVYDPKTWKPDGLSWLELTQEFIPYDLRNLADSGAPLLLGHDLHNQDMWLSSESLKKRLKLLEDCGITLDRFVNRSPQAFRDFMSA
jgi:histidinol phosphatase-like PHP family hydrolase